MIRYTITDHAPSSRMALSALASKTGCASVRAWLMTRGMSQVTVCASSAVVSSRLLARSSVNNRTFSMAITVWSAKVWTSPISVSLNGWTSGRHKVRAPIGRPSRIIGTARAVRKLCIVFRRGAP